MWRSENKKKHKRGRMGRIRFTTGNNGGTGLERSEIENEDRR